MLLQKKDESVSKNVNESLMAKLRPFRSSAAAQHASIGVSSAGSASGSSSQEASCTLFHLLPPLSSCHEYWLPLFVRTFRSSVELWNSFEELITGADIHLWIVRRHSDHGDWLWQCKQSAVWDLLNYFRTSRFVNPFITVQHTGFITVLLMFQPWPPT